jgi:hypothetical protein
MDIKVYILFVWEYRWQFILAFLLIRYGKTAYTELFFNPLAGGNGKVQMDEVGKAVILGIAIYCVIKEAMRTHEWMLFPESFWYALFGALFLIAGLKEGKNLINKIKNHNHDTNESKA